MPAHILVLTARDTPEDKVSGLELGADDYLVKPFHLAELLRASRRWFVENTTPRRRFFTSLTWMLILSIESSGAAAN